MPNRAKPDTSATPQVLQGTLDAMILSVLRDRPRHGYAIAREIERRAQGGVAVEEGSLYPALQRLSKRGDVFSEWVTTDKGRRGREYRISTRGRSRLAEQVALWGRLAAAVGRVLEGDG